MLFIENAVMLPPLHLAAFEGDLEAIRDAIENGEPVDGRADTAEDCGRYFHNLTPLMVAAGSPNNTASAVQLLLTLGANPLAKSEGGTSAIWYAAAVDVIRVQLLLTAGADPNETADNGRSVIGEAAGTGNNAVVQLLLSVGVSPNPVSASINTESLQWQLRSGEDSINLFRKNANNVNAMAFQIPLFCAAKSGNAASTLTLLNAGASPIVQDVEGRTALFYASSSEVVTTLRSAGCPLNIVDNYNLSALDSALNNHHAAAVRALVAAGASLIANDANMYSPLIQFCGSLEIDSEMLELLIELGADVHERIEHQRTALHHVVKLITGDRTGKLGDAAKVLVKAGIPVDVCDEDNNTPLHAAVGWEGIDMSAIEALLDLGADVNATNLQGETPLMVAISNGTRSFEVVSLLLGRGADPCIAQPDGKTVYDHAVEAVEQWQQIIADAQDMPDNDKSNTDALAEAEKVRTIVDAALHK